MLQSGFSRTLLKDESMTEKPEQDRHASRRGVLLGVSLAGIGAVTGCSTAAVPYASNEAGQMPGQATQSSAAGGTGTGTGTGTGMGGGNGSGAGGGNAAGAAGTVLGSAKDIPVGGGKVFLDQKVVVTQPAKGKFKAFSAVCTHVGCVCNVVANGTINCPCHGSTFKITNGAVVTGPAETPLPRKKIKVASGGMIHLL